MPQFVLCCLETCSSANLQTAAERPHEERASLCTLPMVDASHEVTSKATLATVNVSTYIERLYVAFAEAPRPSEKEITPHRCGECDEVASRLAPHEHTEVPDKDMHWLGDCLPLLSPKAFRYFLPSFVAFCLTHRESSLDALINYNLAPSTSLDEGERNRFAYFSPAERQVMAEFVEYRGSLEGADLDQVYLDQAAEFWRAKPNTAP